MYVMIVHDSFLVVDAKGKTHFEVSVLLFFFHISSLYFYFEALHPCTFILRYCILVLLFSYRFHPSQLQNHRPGFFFSVVDICTALGFPQLHIDSSVAALPPSSSIFFPQIF